MSDTDAIWQGRLDRERRARKEAEQFLEEKSRALYVKNEALTRHVAELEKTKGDLEAVTTQLSSALEAAASGSQSKSQFLATMSHELRTPLNAIIGFSEIIQTQMFGPVGSERYVGYAQNIHESGAHLLALINDILDISKFDAGRLDLHEEIVDLRSVVASCMRVTEPQATKAKVTLQTHIDPVLVNLRCDERRLRQVLLNLLSNAVKFTPEGGNVTLDAQLRDDGIALVVTDTGIGIAEQDINTALERFGQIDSSLSRKYEGTGLGLPLAKHLAELHGGELTLQSEVGVGTSVTVLLPHDRREDARKIA